MVSSSVSDIIERLSAFIESLSALIFIWRTIPLRYIQNFTFAVKSFAHLQKQCRFPYSGSPLPKQRSRLRPRLKRGQAPKYWFQTLLLLGGYFGKLFRLSAAFELCDLFFEFSVLFSSIIVFHCPQPGHLPIHLGDSQPHSLQKILFFPSISSPNAILQQNQQIVYCKNAEIFRHKKSKLHMWLGSLMPITHFTFFNYCANLLLRHKKK